jgi:hypothetical protein
MSQQNHPPPQTAENNDDNDSSIADNFVRINHHDHDQPAAMSAGIPEKEQAKQQQIIAKLKIAALEVCQYI